MKVLVVNSSPRTEFLSTSKSLLHAFVKGMKEEGAELTEVQLNEADIKDCNGCLCCVSLTPGRCVIKDEMTEKLFPTFLESERMVISSPIYFGMMNAPMKRFIDRLFPYLSNHQEITEEGLPVQRFRGPWPPVVVMATSSWNRRFAFDQLSSYAHYLFGDALAGEIYRGDESIYNHWGKYAAKKQQISQALFDSGREFITEGKVSQAHIDIIESNLGSYEEMVDFTNMCIDSSIHRKISVNRWIETGKYVDPLDIHGFLNFQKMLFRPGTCDHPFTLQFIFSGSVAGACYLNVVRDKFLAEEGMAEKADLTLEAPFELWMGVVNGEYDLANLISKDRIKLNGNIKYLEEYSKVFHFE